MYTYICVKCIYAYLHVKKKLILSNNIYKLCIKLKYKEEEDYKNAGWLWYRAKFFFQSL